MQEEKNNEHGENKQNRPRKHGYFMTPPDKSNGDNKNTNLNAAPTGETATSGEGKKNGRFHHHKNKKKHDGAQKPEGGEEKNVTAAAASSSENAVANGEGAKKKNKHRRNKNKQKSKETAIQPMPAVKAEQKPADQKKSAPVEEKRKNIKDIKAIPTHNPDDYEAYTLVVDDDNEQTVSSEKPTDVPKTEVVGIRFKSSGKIYYFDPKGLKFKKGSHAIVDTARGQEFGEVAMANAMVSTADIIPPLRPAVRNATTADVEHHKANKQKEDEAFRICNGKIAEHKLDMKLIDAQYTFDNSKLLFYFTSSNRVDFRDLVKDLAGAFRTRIELRQIGIRDEAKIMGGLGMCGRPLCCTLFLSDFDQVSIKMAKEQNLSLNSAKISGICGRLMCCLKYEHEAYEYEIKRTPPVDSLVRTENGDGIVTEISPLTKTVKVRLLASPEVPPKAYKRDEIKMLRKKQKSND